MRKKGTLGQDHLPKEHNEQIGWTAGKNSPENNKGKQ